MKAMLSRLIREENGQNLVEYALLAGLVALVALAAVTSVGKEITTVYGKLQTSLSKIVVP